MRILRRNNMFRSLDFNIEQYENDDYDDAWIDSGAQEVSIYCLNDFTEDDWKKFYEEVPKKSTGWKIRFVDCITDDHSGSEQLKALLYLTNTDDMELLTRIIDRLLCSDDLDLPCLKI